MRESEQGQSDFVVSGWEVVGGVRFQEEMYLVTLKTITVREDIL
jgi:hypothetical protein